jgi:hypothetical protein
MKKYKDPFDREIEAVVYDGTVESIADIKELSGGDPVQAEGQMLGGAPDLLLDMSSGTIRLSDGMAIVKDNGFVYSVEAAYFAAKYEAVND